MKQINEEWRPIVGYEGLYVVSNFGRVKSLPRGKQWPYRKAVGEKNSKAVRQLSRDGQLIAVYKSLAEASEKTGINISTIIRHCKGRISGSVRKYIFEYA